jgi:phosphodiesterase/alkaline phosphatase D-like protein
MGTSQSSLTEVHTGYSWTNPPGLSTAINFHEVHVCGLKPGTTYYYQVGGGASGKETWSATQSFTTVPAAASGPVKLALYGDARDSFSVWQTVHQHVKAQGVDMHLISGDIVYVGAIEAQWSQWLDAIWKNGSSFLTLGETLMVPIAGNHEAESPDFYRPWRWRRRRPR